MTATAHLLVGASLGKIFPNPYLAFPLVFISNFLMDLVPHWDLGINWRKRPKIYTFILTAIDVILGFSIGLLILGKETDLLYIFSCMMIATLADWLEAPYIFLGWNFPPFSWIYKLQSKLHHRNGTILGIITQIIIVTPFIFLAYKK